jgi:hypothetical protein
MSDTIKQIRTTILHEAYDHYEAVSRLRGCTEAERTILTQKCQEITAMLKELND